MAIADPIRFGSDLRVIIPGLGLWGKFHKGYFYRQDDLASVAYWYQTLSTAAFPALPANDELEVL